MENINKENKFVKLNYTQNIIPFYQNRVELNYIVANNFGEWLKDLRKNRDWSQEDLAEKSRVTKSYISKLEKNQIAQPRLYQIEKICKALNVSFDEAKKLLYLSQDMQTNSTPGFYAGYEKLSPEMKKLADKQIAAIIESLQDVDTENISYIDD